MRTLEQIKHAYEEEELTENLLRKKHVSDIVNKMGKDFVGTMEESIFSEDEHSRLCFELKDFHKQDNHNGWAFHRLEDLVKKEVEILRQKLQRQMKKAGHTEWILSVYNSEGYDRDSRYHICKIKLEKERKKD